MASYTTKPERADALMCWLWEDGGWVSAAGSPGPYTYILDTLADIMFFRITPGCRGKCWDTPARNLGSNETGTAASRHDTKLSRIWWESLTGAT